VRPNSSELSQLWMQLLHSDSRAARKRGICGLLLCKASGGVAGVYTYVTSYWHNHFSQLVPVHRENCERANENCLENGLNEKILSAGCRHFSLCALIEYTWRLIYGVHLLYWLINFPLEIEGEDTKNLVFLGISLD